MSPDVTKRRGSRITWADVPAAVLVTLCALSLAARVLLLLGR